MVETTEGLVQAELAALALVEVYLRRVYVCTVEDAGGIVIGERVRCIMYT